ncbi:alpha/beta fold hydrolase [Herbidospora sp. NBRC 101105]|uniref:alpha/beta hydrolase n=1 Tax=Herbidospora sp. NBRC 101105 TaxID=3032195 RepID=UPI0024A315DB|nr:alpha/beta fold hydrolase [Herbidospora sp. NBRC 101105]GLX93553.1 alpha/beta hydrolase [Herbidospora sp. NBRC 101105]
MESMPYTTVHPARGTTRLVTLVLHGGREVGPGPTSAWQLAVLRMVPFAWAIRNAGTRRGVAVWRVRYRVRGWNGPAASPVGDVERVLEQVRLAHGDDVPVVMVGHSMGGRTALRAAGHPSVRGVAALAPWLPKGEPVEQLRGRRVLLAHGTTDRVTSPRATHHYADRVREVTGDVRVVDVPGENHAMVRKPGYWHDLSADFVLSFLPGSSSGRSFNP